MHGPSEEQPTFKRTEEQALATFSHAAEELRFFKGQQWHVTNYALIAYAALTAAPSWVEPDSWRSSVSLLAFVLVWVMAAAAWRLLATLEASLEKERRRLVAARDHLALMHKVHQQHPPEDRSAMSWWRRLSRPPVMPVLVAVVLFGALVATLINLSRIPSVQRVVACISVGAP